MSTNRGIFESFPNQPQDRPDSPFSVATDSGGEQAKASPFGPPAGQASPFSVVDEAAEAKAAGFDKPVKLPERRKVDSPFQMADPSEGFGFEAPAKTPASNPFESAPAPSPFSTFAEKAPASPPASPFAAEPPPRAASPSTQAAIAAFTDWQEPPAQKPSPLSSAAEHVPAQVPSAFAAAPEPQTPAPQQAVPAEQAPVSAPVAPQEQASQSDSFNIRQLELRAIFGVDREMNADEILQRSRALPGMRNIARMSAQDMATVDGLKGLLPSLGFGSGSLKLYSGSVPLEFIREGSTMLAVQTDGGFAPGVRETLMIVARELGKIG